MRFITDCVHSNGPDITAMVDAAIDITRRTFLRHVDRNDLERVEGGLGYEKDPRKGLTMAADYHVSYHRSKFQGRRCYYFQWSAIEHIFQTVQDCG